LFSLVFSASREQPNSLLPVFAGGAMNAVIDVSEEIKQDGSVAAPLSEDYLGLRFAYEYHAKLRYTAEFGRWNEYQNGVWTSDRTLHYFDLARSLCRTVAMEISDEKLARLRRQLTSASTVAAVVKFAQGDQRLAMRADQWDANPWLLNTPAGTVDLKTGEIRPHDPNDYCSKITEASPTPKGTEAPLLWKKFLRDITCGDQELESFLRRSYGYSLSAR
jgi:putative DNA primase/helicase